MSEMSMSWGELANLTHETQVAHFGFCSCEDNEGRENPYSDCPKEAQMNKQKLLEQPMAICRGCGWEIGRFLQYIEPICDDCQGNI